MSEVPETIETVLVRLTGQVRMALPSLQARAEFIAELETESAKINCGQYTVFEKEMFIAWMMEGYSSRVQPR